jgi:hypothetical protein
MKIHIQNFDELKKLRVKKTMTCENPNSKNSRSKICKFKGTLKRQNGGNNK